MNGASGGSFDPASSAGLLTTARTRSRRSSSEVSFNVAGEMTCQAFDSRARSLTLQPCQVELHGRDERLSSSDTLRIHMALLFPRTCARAPCFAWVLHLLIVSARAEHE